MPKYLALTIGPIQQTLSTARKTRQLWAGSYMFSYLMKKVLLKYHGRKDITILLPFTDTAMFTAKKGAGLFSDRCLIEITKPKTDHDYYEEMKNQIHEAIEDIGEAFFSKKPSIVADLKRFFQTYFLEVEIPETDNPILKITEMLDSMEQTPRYLSRDFLGDMNKFLDQANDKIFYADAGISKAKGFRSIPEISSTDLRRLNSNEYDKLVSAQKSASNEKDELIVSLQKHKIFGSHFKNYHKYIAIVKADGDRIGEAIHKIGNHDSNMKAFQQIIAEFASESLLHIDRYGGAAVFAGGDDLLFFAPVANGEKSECPTVFHLIKNLDKLFKDKMDAFKDIHLGEATPTLSFGVSISFYKFPMGEALEKANELIQRAKDSGRNAAAISLQKHSQGRTDEDYFIWRKSSNSFTEFLAEGGLLDFYSADEQNRLHSVKHLLTQQKSELNALFNDKHKHHAQERLEYFFKENFNEQEHIEQHENYLRQVRNFLYTSLLDHQYNGEKALNTLDNALDFIQFVNADDKS